MPIQNINWVVSGANQGNTGSTQISVTNGSGSCTISLTSAKAGVDTVVAYLQSLNLSSNQAQVVWQNTNGPIATSPVNVYTLSSAYRGAATGNFPAGLTQSMFTGPQTLNSLMFNTAPNILPGDPHATGYRANPFVNNVITATGKYAGDTALTGSTTGAFTMVATGSFVVAAPGQKSFTCTVNSSFLLGVGGGATYVSGANINSGVTTTPFNNFPVLGAFNGPNRTFPGGIGATETFTLNFATAGVYPYELCFVAGVSQERTLSLLANNAVIPPIQLITTPPAPTAASSSAKLSLTPVSAGSFIVGTTATFTLSAQNLVFSTVPYMPLLEGTTARVFLVNQNGTNFAFPTPPNTSSVDPNLALNTLTLSGDNASWKNKIGITWNGTSYTLAYNGNPTDPGVPVTNLSCSAVDIAWYNPAGSLDMYQTSARGGGSSNSIAIYWLVNPTIASYTPQSLFAPAASATAAPTTVLFTLSKPLPYFQASAVCQVTVGAGLAFNSVAAVPVTINGLAWVMGYNVQVTPATVTIPTNTSITITLSDTQTYMQDATFVTNTLTYVNQVSFPITLSPAPKGGPATSVNTNR